jgi:hypothetical protein
MVIETESTILYTNQHPVADPSHANAPAFSRLFPPFFALRRWNLLSQDMDFNAGQFQDAGVSIADLGVQLFRVRN